MKYAFITDSNLAPLYGSDDWFVVPAGESSKSLQRVEELASKLAQKGYGRETTLVAVGGGMVGDLVGFLASIYCRGIPFVLVPTTLLAMVDASIGGKTAVNLREGKNLLGLVAFPKQVILHFPFLESLPDSEWENGVIEILKMGLLFDADLFFHFSQLSLKAVIGRAIEAKRRVVSQDPYEKGCRALLNLGHTIGHALESLSNYRISHGKAVSHGIVLEARLSHAMGILSYDDVQVIESHFPPVQIDASPAAIIQQLSKDKKARNGAAHFVLLEKIGVPYITEGKFTHPVDTALLTQVLYEASLCSR